MASNKKFVQAYLSEELHCWLQRDLRAAEDAANKDSSMSAHVGGILETYARARGFVPEAETGPSDPGQLKSGFDKLLTTNPDAAKALMVSLFDSLKSGGSLKALCCYV
jgi:hypothetical protein